MKNKKRNEELNKIYEALKKEEQKNIKHDIALAPQWIKEIMKKSIA